jgi:hypothetical protein
VLFRRLRVSVAGGGPLPALAAIAAAGCGDASRVRPDDIRAYVVPRALEPRAVAAAAPVTASAVGSLRLSYDVPKGWSDLGADGMRLATLAIGGEAAGRQVTVIPASGSLRGNVDRWHGQLEPEADAEARAAAVEAALSAAETVAVGEHEATIVMLVDAAASREAEAGRAILGAVIPLDDSRSLFVKYLGDAAVARHERERFVEFVKSLRWQ